MKTLHALCKQYNIKYMDIYGNLSRMRMFSTYTDGKLMGIEPAFIRCKSIMDTGKTFAQACQIMRMDEI